MSGYQVSPNDWPGGKPSLGADEAEKVLEGLDRLPGIEIADSWKARALRAERALDAVEEVCRDLDGRTYQISYQKAALLVRLAIQESQREDAP